MVPVHREAAYSASKAGLRAFGRVLSMELEEKSIHVANINPGPVSTAFLGDIATVPDIVMSQPMRDADTVAALILDAIINRKTEKAIPAHSGALATLGYLFPSLLKNTRPLLEKLGAKRKQQILRARKS
jgi:short-subunit dehydrogenase